MNKNEIVTLEITSITNEGNGVGRYENMAVFVPFTAVGDVIECKIVKLKKTYAYGIINKIIAPSPFRTEPECDVFKKCGGCAFFHFNYQEELRVKEEFVKASFERIGKLKVDFTPILGCESISEYRNKAMYPVGEDENGKLVCGFFSRRTHRVIPQTECALQPKIFSEILQFILNWCNENNVKAYSEETHKGLLRHIYLRKGEHSGKIMVCLVVTSFEKTNFVPLATELAKAFENIKSVVLNLNSKNTNVILGERCKTIWGEDFITDQMCGKTFRISPLSFYQVNTTQAERLYEIAKTYADLKGNESIFDLYCGVGTIGLSVAGENKLVGVEIIPQAIGNAKENARLNGKNNAEFICGDVGKVTEMLIKRGETPDVIIADPARKGCDSLSLECMLKLNPKRIVMISCNHATCARDCRFLVDHGYEIQKAQAVDLFPRTSHVETVCLLSRK